MIAAQDPINLAESHFIIRPNNSLSWYGTRIFFIAAAGVTLAVALLFAAKGAWMIVPFAGLEIAGLGVCLYLCAHKNNQREVIRIGEESVTVEKGRNEVRHRIEFQRQWVQVRLTRCRRDWYPSRLTICSKGKEIEVGSALLDADRAALARELRRRITS